MKRQQPKQFSLFGKADKGALLFVADSAQLFLSHRLPIALTALKSGYDVHVAAPYHYQSEQFIESYAITFHPLPPIPEKISFFSDFKALFHLRRIFREINPDLVHLIALKPTLYGSIAARMAKVRAVVATITSTRKVQPEPHQGTAGLRLRFIRFLYGIGFSHPNLRVTFQNVADRDVFLNMGLVSRRQITLIRGTGVNMQQYHPFPELSSLPVVMLASRMRWDKGVNEFVQAAKLLSHAGIQARFVLAGGIDPGHPDAIAEEQLENWKKEGVIEWWGENSDMPLVLAQAHIVCLPSYREGLPKVLIEAAACGKPIVTTDVAGSREVVTDGENGLLVPVRDIENLAVALNLLLGNPDLRLAMGQRGRNKVVTEFSIGHVVEKTLGMYDALLG